MSIISYSTLNKNYPEIHSDSQEKMRGERIGVKVVGKGKLINEKE